MDFPVWTARMRTPDDNIRAIRALQAAASSETRAHFAIEADGSFLLDILMLETRSDLRRLHGGGGGGGGGGGAHGGGGGGGGGGVGEECGGCGIGGDWRGRGVA